MSLRDDLVSERELHVRNLRKAYKAITAELGHSRFRPLVEGMYEAHVQALGSVGEQEQDADALVSLREMVDALGRGMRSAGVVAG